MELYLPALIVPPAGVSSALAGARTSAKALTVALQMWIIFIRGF